MRLTNITPLRQRLQNIITSWSKEHYRRVKEYHYWEDEEQKDPIPPEKYKQHIRAENAVSDLRPPLAEKNSFEFGEIDDYPLMTDMITLFLMLEMLQYFVRFQNNLIDPQMMTLGEIGEIVLTTEIATQTAPFILIFGIASMFTLSKIVYPIFMNCAKVVLLIIETSVKIAAWCIAVLNQKIRLQLAYRQHKKVYAASTEKSSQT